MCKRDKGGGDREGVRRGREGVRRGQERGEVGRVFHLQTSVLDEKGVVSEDQEPLVLQRLALVGPFDGGGWGP